MGYIGCMVSLLPIVDDIESPLGVEFRLGKYTGKQEACLWQSQSRSLVSQSKLEPHQKEVGQNAQSHMMMPAKPTAHLIVSHAEALFAIFKASQWSNHK